MRTLRWKGEDTDDGEEDADQAGNEKLPGKKTGKKKKTKASPQKKKKKKKAPTPQKSQRRLARLSQKVMLLLLTASTKLEITRPNARSS